LIERINIYCDASYSPDYDIAVLGWAILSNGEESVSRESILTKVISTTSNTRAELQAALLALSQVDIKAEQITLYSDCLTLCELPKRRVKLEQNSFLSKKTKKILNNGDLYKELFKYFDSLPIDLQWVKGHSPKAQKNQISSNFSVVDKFVRHSLRSHIKASGKTNF